MSIQLGKHFTVSFLQQAKIVIILSWITNKFKIYLFLMLELDFWHNRATRSKNYFDMSTYRKLRNKVTIQIQNQKKHFISSHLNKSRGQPGKTWKVLKQFLPSKHSQNQCINFFSAYDFLIAH